ncbi:MAG: nitroreductase family protein [Oscillospiraceae bacterium]
MLFDLIASRQSCRNFDGRPVAREKLDQCIEAARLSPSACNSQPWRFVVVDDVQRAKQVAQCLQEGGMNRFTDQCATFVVVIEGSQNLTERMGGAVKDQKFSNIDIGLTTAHLVLSAAEQDLATCIIGWFNERKLKMLLGIPKARRVRLVVAMGYADKTDPLRDKQRKAMAEIVSYNKF